MVEHFFVKTKKNLKLIKEKDPFIVSSTSLHRSTPVITPFEQYRLRAKK